MKTFRKVGASVALALGMLPCAWGDQPGIQEVVWLHNQSREKCWITNLYSTVSMKVCTLRRDGAVETMDVEDQGGLVQVLDPGELLFILSNQPGRKFRNVYTVVTDSREKVGTLMHSEYHPEPGASQGWDILSPRTGTGAAGGSHRITRVSRRLVRITDASSPKSEAARPTHR